MQAAVASVCLLGIPPKVLDPIVCRIAIVVASLGPRRPWTDEEVEDQAMNPESARFPALTHGDSEVPGWADIWCQESASNPLTLGVDAIQGTNVTIVGYRVATLISRDLSPFLHQIRISSMLARRSVAGRPSVAVVKLLTMLVTLISNVSAAAWMASVQRVSG